MFSKLICTVEGTNLASRFIPNELSIYDLKTQTLRHYFIDPPAGFTRLSPEDKRTDCFTRVKLGGRGIRRYEGLPGISAAEGRVIMMMLKGHKIFVMGSTTKLFLSSLLPEEDIIDVQDIMPISYPTLLPPSGCGEPHKNYRHCTLAKLHYIRRILARNTAVLQ